MNGVINGVRVHGLTNWSHIVDQFTLTSFTNEQVLSLKRSLRAVALSATNAAGRVALIPLPIPVPIEQKQLQPRTMRSNSQFLAR